MREYFVAQELIYFNTDRAKKAGEWMDPRDGYICLWNKNAGTTHYFKVKGQCQNRFGWIVETDDVPAYFARVLTPNDQTASATTTIQSAIASVPVRKSTLTKRYKYSKYRRLRRSTLKGDSREQVWLLFSNEDQRMASIQESGHLLGLPQVPG